jgi:hypothetical protein
MIQQGGARADPIVPFHRSSIGFFLESANSIAQRIGQTTRLSFGTGI